MAKVTLSTIQQAADTKYGSYDIDLGDGKAEVILLNPTRLSDEDRASMTAKADVEKNEDGSDKEESDSAVTDRLTNLIRIAAVTDDMADRLIAAVSPRGYVDLGLLSIIVDGYMGGEKVGEASPSQV
jgi:hypothetical protein